jgi:serine/threonine protein phosphatase PrpC
VQNHNQNEIDFFTLPKIGERTEEIQDAYYKSSDSNLAAIADGASTSFLAREWADLLVESFCKNNEESNTINRQWKEWLKPLQEQWRQYSIKIRTDPNLPWYAKGSKEKICGSATFVGLKLYPTNQGKQKTWEALAIGDSCLFQIKANSDQLISFPIQKSEEFHTVTDCFQSLPEYNVSEPTYINSYYDKDDIFFLATDALAEWIFKDSEKGGSHWRKLISITNQKEFAELIQQIRHEKLIKNDDTTLCRIVVKISEVEVSHNSLSTEANLPLSQNNHSIKIEENHHSSSQNHKITANNPRLKILLLLGAALIFIGSILFVVIFLNKIISTRNSASKSPSHSFELSNNNNYSSFTSHQQIPIYDVDKTSNQPIGYLWKKQPESGNSKELWVLVPLAYIKYVAKTNEEELVIPNDSTPLPLFKSTPEPKNISLQEGDFVGYLLPGRYPLPQLKKESKTFPNAWWVKIKFN